MLNIELLKPSRMFSSNTYLISSNGEYAVIDPSTRFCFSDIADKIKYVLLTHSHFDHILDIDEWAEKTGAKVMISEKEIDFLPDANKNCFNAFLNINRGYHGKAHPLYDGDIIHLGNTDITVMLTPGHTVGSVCYYAENCLFCGDTVFAGGGYGRFDLPSGDFYTLKESINKILKLPQNTSFFPGHGPSTTLNQYKNDFKL